MTKHEPSNTPLADVHKRLGAHFTEFAGWTMPVRYTSDVAEHHAVRTAAGLFDLSHMGELDVTGPGAGAGLDNAVVGKPSAMSIGQARYSMLCDEVGGILDDLVIYRLTDEHYMVVASASNVATVCEALTKRTAGHEAKVDDVTSDWALIAVQGPASEGILAEVIDADLGSVRYYTIVAAQILGVDILLARTGYTGEDGFEIYCPSDLAERIWTALQSAGKSRGLVPAGLACRDTLRLEAGMPLYGNELSRHITPFEAGLGRVVNFKKEAGFVEATALLARREQGVASTLVGLVSQGRRSPRSGYVVLSQATGQQIGRVTSGAPSPTLGHPIAMALLEVEFKEPGTQLIVDVRGAREPVKVVPLPFYRRETP